MISFFAVAELNWNQHGLPGLVIGAMFLTLSFFIRQHYTERKEWREDFKSIAEKQDATATATVTQFVDLHREQTEVFRKLHEDTLTRLRDDNARNR